LYESEIAFIFFVAFGLQYNDHSEWFFVPEEYVLPTREQGFDHSKRFYSFCQYRVETGTGAATSVKSE
jgi:hypothetical protein